MVAAIVVMNRTLHTNDVVARIKAEIEKINTDGTPAARREARAVLRPHRRWSTSPPQTVLHNLVFGCLLVFFIQWMFLGDLRSAIIVGVNIPFALFFSIIILVLRGEDANLLSVGAVDFGIIVDCRGDPGREHLSGISRRARRRQTLLEQLAEGKWGPIRPRGERSRARRVDRPAAPDLRQRAAGRQGGVLLDRHHRRGLRSAVHHAGRRGPDLRPDGAHLRLCAGRRADRDFHGHAGAGVAACSRSTSTEVETVVVRWLRAAYTPVLRWSLEPSRGSRW